MLTSGVMQKSGKILFERAAKSAFQLCPRRLPPTSAAGMLNLTMQHRQSSSSPETLSNRAAFKAMSVDPKILQYIQKIGVGIPKRNSSRRRLRQSPSRRYSRKHDTLVLDTEEELDFFRQRTRNIQKERRARKKPIDGRPRSSLSWLPPPPFASSPQTSQDEDETAMGYKVKRHPVKIIGSVGALGDRFPKKKGLPEVAVAGRSNVGKSTLLNALLYGNIQDGSAIEQTRKRGKVPEHKKLPRGIKAITSDRPGETRKITFYQLSSELSLNEKDKATMAMLLVDLPGYGFAYASESKAQEWRDLMKDYILHRGKSLKRVLLLIDARHGFKKADRDFLESLQSALYSEAQQEDTTSPKSKRDLPPIQLVLTKCDLVSQTDLARRVVQARKDLSDCLRRQPSSLPVMLVSAKPGVGYNNVREDRALGGVLELQREIAALAPEPKHFSRRSRRQRMTSSADNTDND